MQPLPPESLLLEVQDILRTMPSVRDFYSDSTRCVGWLGRASALMNNSDMARSTLHFEPEARRYSSLYANRDRVHFEPLHQTLLQMLHQAENDLRLRTAGPLSVGIGSGRVFEYFDEVRKLIESARSDLLFVDPYIDAEFVSRYLPHVAAGTAGRLLARERLNTLKPAVAAFSGQTGTTVEIRTASGFHDRYLLIDKQACYQSGASFKDGAKKAPTVLTQITDAFGALSSTSEALWAGAALA